MSRKKRNLAQTKNYISSEENEEPVSEKSSNQSSKKEIAGNKLPEDLPKVTTKEQMETHPMEITSLVRDICFMLVPQEENLAEE